MSDKQTIDIVKGAHVYKDGKYVEIEGGYSHQPFPKTKYHVNEAPIQVANEEEEEALGENWKDSPADHGIITAPDAKEIQRRKIAEANSSADWKKALPAQPVVLTDHHVAFLQASGLSDVTNLEGVYAFLAKLNTAQQANFLAEAAAWKKPKAKTEGTKQ